MNQAFNGNETGVKTRLSVRLPPELHMESELIVHDKKVPLAWVMREATKKYVAKSMAAAQEAKVNLG